jgi:hypothetical protein
LIRYNYDLDLKKKKQKKKLQKKKLTKKKNFLRTDGQTDGQPKTIVRNLTKVLTRNNNNNHMTFRSG